MRLRQFLVAAILCSASVPLHAEYPEAFRERLEQGEPELSVKLLRPAAEPHAFMGHMQLLIRKERETTGHDNAFTRVVIASLRDAADEGAVEASAFTELESVECTASLCELVIEATYLANPGIVNRGLRVSLLNRGEDTPMVSSAMTQDGRKLHVFVIRPSFADAVSSGQ